jgi:MFS transporter, FSR family, fosmidomycin resistance protein
MDSVTFSSSSAPARADVPWAQDAKVMVLVGLAHASSHFGHMLLPPLFPVFMKEFGLNFSQVGLLVSVFFIVSGIGQALSGFVVDRLGARPVLFSALSLFILACLVASSANGYPMLMLAAALAGAANSSYHPVDFSILNQRVSSPRLGHAYSLHGISGNMGWAIAPLFLVGLSSAWGWRGAYLCAALLYAAILLTLVLARSHLSIGVAKKVVHTQASAEGTFDFLKLPVVWWCFTFFLLSTITLAVIQSFGASIFERQHGVSAQIAAAILTAYMIASSLGMLAGGFVQARLGAAQSDKVVAACMFAGALIMMLAGTGWLGGWGSMALLAATGFAVGIGGPSRDVMIKRAAPAGATGRVYGTVYCGLDIGFAIAPVIFGVLMDKALYSATVIGSAFALMLACAAALAVGARTEKR